MSDETKKSLTETDITSAPVGRRSVLGLIGAAGAGAALIAGTTKPAEAATDGDAGQAADPAGRGRGYPRARASGQTDRDSGNLADPAGNGRGGAAQRRAGITDNDAGATADPAGNGRGNGRGRQSGTTDRDPSADPAGNGRDVR